MNISVDHLGKKFNKEWIFRDLAFQFNDSSCTSITGSNGSGKSTLIKIIAGFNDPTLGEVTYSKTSPETHISLAAPYLELIEELTLAEMADFHFTFKKRHLSNTDLAERAGLSKSFNKPIADFSSGMKQRLKLALALFAETSLLLLDEPTANMDEQGIDWYQKELHTIKGSRTIIIASNQRSEINLCEQELSIERFKKK
ncbi:MAG: ABC-type multidrug transport system ATPase subunit [Cyclobacteriaceae bacterium]|jgi:ABC-type multidrug transport system ATPase subunit